MPYASPSAGGQKEVLIRQSQHGASGDPSQGCGQPKAKEEVNPTTTDYTPCVRNTVVAILGDSPVLIFPLSERKIKNCVRNISQVLMGEFRHVSCI